MVRVVIDENIGQMNDHHTPVFAGLGHALHTLFKTASCTEIVPGLEIVFINLDLSLSPAVRSFSRLQLRELDRMLAGVLFNIPGTTITLRYGVTTRSGLGRKLMSSSTSRTQKLFNVQVAQTQMWLQAKFLCTSYKWHLCNWQRNRT